MDKLIRQIKGVSLQPFVTCPKPKYVDPDFESRKSDLLGFKKEFMLHEPPSETDACLGYGNPDVEVRDIAIAFCDAVARKFDLFTPVFKANSHLLPPESVRLFTKMMERVKEGRMEWGNRLRSRHTLVIGRDYKTAGLEFHFHRLVTEAINFELERVFGHEPSSVALAVHSISLREGAGQCETD
jgi:hypothetical protein